MKPGCYLAVALLLFGLVPVKQLVQKQQYHSHRDKNRTQYIGYSGITPIIATENPHSTSIKRGTNQDSKDGWDSPIWPAWALVALGIIASIIGGKTISATKRAANAAKDSADRLLDIEKGFIRLDMLPVPKLRPLKNGENIFDNSIQFTFSNIGRTAVWITRGRYTYRTSDEIEIQGPIDYKSCQPLPNQEAIPPGKSTQPITAILAPNPVLTRTQVEGIKSGKYFVYFYGFVEYRDVFTPTDESPRETYFCYRLEIYMGILYRGGLEHMWAEHGPKEANHYT